MKIRDERQIEFADKFLSTGTSGILNLCPRFGKTRVGIHILQKTGRNPKVLIAYPHNKVEKAWKDEFLKMGYKNPNITFTTHLSLKKYKDIKYDILVIDEIHLLSERQIEAVQEITCKITLGLTGTLSSWTERCLQKKLGLNVIGKYSMDQAIKEGVVTDYQITVKMVPLNDIVLNKYKKYTRTEKGQFRAYGKVIEALEAKGKETFFLRLARMRIIQNSLAKIDATKNILNIFNMDRALVFCGLIKTAEAIGCPVFHNKSKDGAIFEDFAAGKGRNHLALVRMGNTGVTYISLNKVVINYFDSNSENLTQKINRCMAMDYSNPDKKSDIWIVSSNEEVELKWLKSALEFFDPKKIKYV